MIKITKWVDPENLKGYFELEDFNDVYEDVIIKDLIENNYIMCGDTYQYRYIPVFNNRYFLLISMRRWGEIMAKAMNIKENTDKYRYTDFYLAAMCNIEEVTPNVEL